MICSQARLEANQRNAKKSTGPRTIEGKSISRANGLKHGLCSSIVVPEDVDLIQKRSEEIYRAFKPYTEYQAWQVDRAAVLTLRVERVERMERRIRDKVSLRAELTWDDDRRLEAEVLGGMLSRKPAETVETLRRTPHGCEWLMGRWALLAHAANTQEGGWTAEQAELAFDLLGTPTPFRQGHKPGASIDFRGNVLEPEGDPAAVARRMVDELEARRVVVRDLDEVDRTLTEADLDHDTCAELRRLRRYESTLHRRLRWTVGQLTFQGPEGKPDPGLFPAWKVEGPPALKPEPKSEVDKAIDAHDPRSFSPPFDLTPDEAPPIGQRPDLEKIRESRKKKRRDKDRARREADRAKARKLKA